MDHQISKLNSHHFEFKPTFPQHNRSPGNYNGIVRCIYNKNTPYLGYLIWNVAPNLQISCPSNFYSPGSQNASLNSIYFSVFSLISCPEMSYNLTMTSTDTTTQQVVINNQKIVAFDENIHCSKCVYRLRTCRNVCHDRNSSLDKMMTTVIKNDLLVNHWISSSKTIEITITFSNPNEKLQPNQCSPFLDHLNCPVCFQYFSAQIYTCKTGHSVCNSCKNSTDKCSICNSAYEGSRNFALENILENLQVQCSNKEDGCKFVGNPMMVREHEKVCIR